MYSLVEEVLYAPDIGSYRTYGLHEQSGIHVSDISTDRKKVEDLIRRCNEGELDPRHIMEVIEDIL